MRSAVLRRVLAVVLTIAAVTLAVTQLRYQPAGSARIVVRGASVRSLTGRLGWSPGFGGTSCIAPVADTAHLGFDRAVPLQTRLGDMRARVRFRYAAPDGSYPAIVTRGDWCRGLDAFVGQKMVRAIAELDPLRVVADRRVAGEDLERALGQALTRAAVAADQISVRLDVADEVRRAMPRPDVASMSERRPPVMFVGLDGADWQLLDQLMAQGDMPNLASLVREGRSGDLTTMHPPLSPLLWTSMMTGVGPLQHRILDFTRFNPVSHEREPITSDERRAPAIWNIETFAGKSTGVFGLWATSPAEPLAGTIASDRLMTGGSSAPYLVYPPSAAAGDRDAVARAEQRIDLAAMQTWLPWLDASTYDGSMKATEAWANPVAALRKILIETRVYDELARAYWRTARPDLLILYLQGTDEIGHIFAPYYPPRQPNIPESDFAHYNGVPRLYFREVDRLLGDYRKLASERGAVLMIASDHGFLWFEGRPTQLSSAATATAAKWHRNEGIWLLWGNGISATPHRSGTPAHLLQVTSTLTSLTGTPGISANGEAPLGGVVASRKTFDYAAVFTPWTPPQVAAAAPNQEEIAKLRALGYLGGNESTHASAPSQEAPTRTPGSYNNEGLILRNEKKVDAAIAAFQQAIAIEPNYASALWNLSDLLWQEKRDERRSNELLVKAVGYGLAEGESFVIGRAIYYQRAGHAERSVELLSAAIEAAPSSGELYLFRGRYRVDGHDCAGAMADFQTAQRLRPADPNAWASGAVAALCLGDQAQAQRQMEQARRLDPRLARLEP